MNVSEFLAPGQSGLNSDAVARLSNSAQTYVSCHSGQVAGFYSLAVGSVEPASAAPRVTKGIPRNPVPVMILARLAVDLQHQGAGLGKALLKDALLRALPAKPEFKVKGIWASPASRPAYF